MKYTAMKTTRSLIAVTAITLGAFLAGSVSAEENKGRAYDEIEFTEGAPGVHFGLLWGDWNTGPFSMIVRIEGGAKAPDRKLQRRIDSR